MKNAYKIAGLGLILGTAVSLAAVPASARGPVGDRFGGPADFGERGNIFASAFADIDLNGDGQITEEDLVAGAEARFAKVDADGNGLLSTEELAASIQARMAERIGNTGGRMPRGMNAQTMATQIATRMLEARDADKDGAVSLAELTPQNGYGFGRLIDRFDTDDDNAISQAEFDTAKQEIQDRFAKRDDRGGRNGWDDRRGDRGPGGKDQRGPQGGRW